MLPTAVKRVQFYSRNSHEKYVYWLIETVKIPYHESLFKTNSRNVVDELVVKMISEGKTITETTILAPIIREIEDTPLEPVIKVIEEKVAEVEPSWVESAKNAIGNVVEDVVEMMIVPEVENPFGGEVDYNSYTVRELQKECKARGITIRGTKSEVVLRLRHDDAGIVEQPTQGVTDAPSQEAADETLDTPSQEAVTEEVTTNDDSGQTELTNEEE